MSIERKRPIATDQPLSRAAAAASEAISFTTNIAPEGAQACLPELSLVAAIFGDAVRCARRAGGSVTHRQSSEAREWIASERRDWPFTFVNVCDFLGIDPKTVRTRLQAGDEWKGPGNRLGYA